ncbi:hypothetical protein HDK77DRAFT_318703 [Phyllosticta capitalensis]
MHPSVRPSAGLSVWSLHPIPSRLVFFFFFFSPPPLHGSQSRPPPPAWYGIAWYGTAHAPPTLTPRLRLHSYLTSPQPVTTRVGGWWWWYRHTHYVATSLLSLTWPSYLPSACLSVCLSIHMWQVPSMRMRAHANTCYLLPATYCTCVRIVHSRAVTRVTTMETSSVNHARAEQSRAKQSKARPLEDLSRDKTQTQEHSKKERGNKSFVYLSVLQGVLRR